MPASNEYLDDLPVDQCRRFEKELYPFLETNYNGLLKSLREKKAFDDAIKAEAKKALDEFSEQFKATLKDEQEPPKRSAQRTKRIRRARTPKNPGMTRLREQLATMRRKLPKRRTRRLTSSRPCPHFSTIGGAFAR